jgi:hypothetical protein
MLSMKVFKRIALFFLFFLPAFIGYSQRIVSGRVIDYETKMPLPFVNLAPLNQSQGTSTDIDGKFILHSNEEIKALKLSYVGYENLVYTIKDKDNPIKLEIILKPAVIGLNEVVITSTENPVLRVIRKASSSRSANDPEKLGSFSYTSYNKMYVTSDMYRFEDTMNVFDHSRPKGPVAKVLEKQHLFLTESVSKRNYLYPKRNNEKVIAARISGLKNPAFTMLATQLQSFSFYDDQIDLLGKKYLSPISKGSSVRYVFAMEDTTYQGLDSIFIVSFQPKKGKNFEGLKGVLYINTNGYAIQNVIAEPVNFRDPVSIKIQQKYEFIDNRQWFPVQLNADWTYNNILLNDSSIEATNQVREADDDNERIVAVSRTYIRDIVINPQLKAKDFGRIEMEVLPDAGEKDEGFWKAYRADSLNQKEKETYHIIDSLGNAKKLDLKLKFISVLLSGKLPAGRVSFELVRFIDYNDYEGLRIGLGAHTNEKISRFFSVGGYFAEGTEDKDEKYGADLSIFPTGLTGFCINAAYSHDLIESAGIKFFEEKKLQVSESYRRYMVIKMDHIDKKELSCSFRAFDYLRANVFFNSQLRNPTDKYEFGITVNGETPLDTSFNFTELGLQFRFLFREKFINIMNTEVSEGSDYPILYGNITRGFDGLLNGEFEYYKFDLRLEKIFTILHLGKSSFQLLAGYIKGSVPYTLIYAGHGSYKRFGISVANTFETMGLNEYMSDRYAALFYTHDFGSLFYKGKKFQPGVSVTTKAGWGALTNQAGHFNIPIKTLERGYYESGILINNILRFGLTGFGIAGFYRYGPYKKEVFSTNAALKFSLNIVF